MKNIFKVVLLGAIIMPGFMFADNSKMLTVGVNPVLGKTQTGIIDMTNPVLQIVKN